MAPKAFTSALGPLIPIVLSQCLQQRLAANSLPIPSRLYIPASFAIIPASFAIGCAYITEFQPVECEQSD